MSITSATTILKRSILLISILSVGVVLTGCLTPSAAQAVQDKLDSPEAAQTAEVLDTVLNTVGLPGITGDILGFIGLIWASIYGTRKVRGAVESVKASPEGKFFK